MTRGNAVATGTPARAAGPALAMALGVATLALLPGCYAPQLAVLRSGLDSLRTVVDTLTVRNEVQYRVLEDTRRMVAEQKDILLSTKATAGSTTQQMYDQMQQLNTRLDEVLKRFNDVAQRQSTPPPASGGPDPNQLYDQASQDLTQGRYALALQGFREFVRRFPSSELADNAQYGVGESWFAQTQFDSAAAAYADVEKRFPQGDKVPAALYKLGLAYDKLGRADEARKTLQDLVKRYPSSGEAQLARDWLGTPHRR